MRICGNSSNAVSERSGLRQGTHQPASLPATTRPSCADLDNPRSGTRCRYSPQRVHGPEHRGPLSGTTRRRLPVLFLVIEEGVAGRSGPGIRPPLHAWGILAATPGGSESRSASGAPPKTRALSQNGRVEEIATVTDVELSEAGSGASCRWQAYAQGPQRRAP